MNKIKSHLNKDIAWGVKMWHIHTALFIAVVIAVLIALTSGVFLASKYGESYFRYQCTKSIDGQCLHHVGYKTPLKEPGASAPIYFPKVTLPSSASVDIKYLPAVGDQDGIGACQCWSSNYYQASYVYRKSPHAHWWRFSPRWCYDSVSNGQDNGSTFDEDVQHGFVQFSAYPYSPHGPDYIANPAPSNLLVRHFNFLTNTITTQQDGGYGAVNAVRYELATLHNPVNIALPVWPEFDNATNNPFINSPTAQEVQNQPYGRGGHAITIIGYNDNINGGRYFRVVNQWSSHWGQNGYGWLSYDFVSKYSWDLKYLTWGGAGKAKAQKPPVFVAPKPHKYFKPSDYTHNPNDNNVSANQLPTATSWYVQGVHTTQGQDISGIINAYGDYYHVWPVGVAATVGTESGFDQYAGRSTSYADTSFGLMQVSIPTLSGYGYPASANWEFNVNNSIMSGVRILHDYSNYTGLSFPNLYIAYNAGPGNGSSFYASPYGQAATNFYSNFLPNFRYALSHFQCYSCSNNPIPSPLPKRKFHAQLWNYYRWAHKESLIKHKYNNHLTWIASVWVNNQYVCRGAVYPEAWNNAGFTREQFQGCAIYTWPKYHSSKTVRTGYWK